MSHLMKGLCALSLVTLVAGCGKSTMTDAQLAQFKELTSSTNNVIKSADNAGKGKSALALATGTSSDLESRLSSGDCSFSHPDVGNGDLAKLSSINLTVSGANCPMTMNIGMRMNGTPSADHIDAQFTMQFEIKDKDLAEASDVTKADLSGTIEGGAGGMKANISGTITSKKYGAVGVKMTMNINENGGSIEAVYSMGFEAKVEVEISRDGTMKFKIGGKEYSQQEFEQFGAIPGMSPTGAASSVPSSSSSSDAYSYDLTENGCKTEKQSFSSKEAMCEGLKDDARNHYCAAYLRETEFKSKGCSGSFN